MRWPNQGWWRGSGAAMIRVGEVRPGEVGAVEVSPSMKAAVRSGPRGEVGRHEMPSRRPGQYCSADGFSLFLFESDTSVVLPLDPAIR